MQTGLNEIISLFEKTHKELLEGPYREDYMCWYRIKKVDKLLENAINAKKPLDAHIVRDMEGYCYNIGPLGEEDCEYAIGVFYNQLIAAYGAYHYPILDRILDEKQSLKAKLRKLEKLIHAYKLRKFHYDYLLYK